MQKNIEDVTNSPRDWEDFWYSPETYGAWYPCDFESIWKEMDSIEPLTPMNEFQRKP